MAETAPGTPKKERRYFSFEIQPRPRREPAERPPGIWREMVVRSYLSHGPSEATRLAASSEKTDIEKLVEDLIANPGNYAGELEEGVLKQLELQREQFISGYGPQRKSGFFNTRKFTDRVKFETKPQAERPAHTTLFFLAPHLELSISAGDFKEARRTLDEIKELDILIPNGRLSRRLEEQESILKAKEPVKTPA